MSINTVSFINKRKKLTQSQMRFWFHELFHKNSSLYTIPMILEFTGKVDSKKIEDAVEKVKICHPVLNSIFIEKNGVHFQLDLTTSDLEEESKKNWKNRKIISAVNEDHAIELAKSFFSKPINIHEEPIFDYKIVEISEEKTWLISSCHHIGFDGISKFVFANEIIDFYNDEISISDRKKDVERKNNAYSELILSEDYSLEVKNQLQWWVNELKDSNPFLNLPTDIPRPSIRTYNGASHEFLIPENILEKIGEISKREKVRKFSILLAALYLTIYGMTKNEDIIISTGVSNRKNEYISDVIGCFVNIILLRIKFDKEYTFRSLVEYINFISKEALIRRDVPFDKLINSLTPGRDLSYNPYTQVMIVYHNITEELRDIGDTKVSILNPEKEKSQSDLLLHIRKDKNRYRCWLEYNTDIFEAKTAENICERYLYFINLIADFYNEKIIKQPQIPTNQENYLLAKNDTKFSFPQLTLKELIEEKINNQPDEIAIITNREKVTYKELEEFSNEVLNKIITSDLTEKQTIGVFLGRSPKMIYSLLAIIRSGCSYVPIDPNYPRDRIEYIINDSKIERIVTEKSLINLLDNVNEKIKLIICDEENIGGESIKKELVNLKSSSCDLLYLIYTSGSTGLPKGVMLDQRGRVSNYHDFNTRFNIGKGDKILAISSLSFDMCAYDIFGTLMAGATIVLPNEAENKDPMCWAEMLDEHQVTIWHSTPSLLNSVLEKFKLRKISKNSSLRLFLLGGDWIPVQMPKEIKAYCSQSPIIISLGGATEVSMDSTIYKIDNVDESWTSIPYGIPMANQTAYVLDENMSLVPIGVPGDLYLGGIGVGWGYYNRPSLTATRFVPNPYNKSGEDTRIYRTGDIARWTNNGNLELLGRSDFQVKINGIRIELGEIDSAIKSIGYKDCITSTFKNKKGENVLVVYIVSADNINWDEVKLQLYDILPAFMVPHYCVILDSLPLSANGKILRTGLPVPEINRKEIINSGLPQTIQEKLLHSIWSIVLDNNNIGVEDNFFDLGGSSMQAATIVNRLPQKISLVDFLRHPTIKRQAEFLQRSTVEKNILFRFETNRKNNKNIIFIPYAGGSAISFMNIFEKIKHVANVMVVDLPHVNLEDIHNESIEKFTDQCLQELKKDGIKNIIIYGHCAGTAFAMELARKLSTENFDVEACFLAASLPPNVESKFKMPQTTNNEIINFLNTLGGMEEISSEEDWPFLLEDFKRDSYLSRDYKNRVFSIFKEPINIPLEIIISKSDPLTSGYEDNHKIWKHYFNRIHLNYIQGDHYFVSSSADQLAKLIISRLCTDE
ncbi:MAG: amino acid adenylation domain-containing protein [Cardiobacteriaceae bacterium]|nr:amino acid adenylation domain-containing protein [Cardiobacteriaceae bacterium]